MIHDGGGSSQSSQIRWQCQWGCFFTFNDTTTQTHFPSTVMAFYAANNCNKSDTVKQVQLIPGWGKFSRQCLRTWEKAAQRDTNPSSVPGLPSGNKYARARGVKVDYKFERTSEQPHRTRIRSPRFFLTPPPTLPRPLRAILQVKSSSSSSTWW